MAVAPESVGHLLGTRGAIAKGILSRTGATVKIGDRPAASGGAGARQDVTIVGDVPAVLKAYSEVRGGGCFPLTPFHPHPSQRANWPR
eukprot:364475-Chlamydomonas_euryale.AAC.1